MSAKSERFQYLYRIRSSIVAPVDKTLQQTIEKKESSWARDYPMAELKHVKPNSYS